MEEKRIAILDRYEYGLILNALNTFRNKVAKENVDVESIDELILKLDKLPVKRNLINRIKHNETR